MNEKSKGEIVIYEAKDGKTTLEVSLKEDTVWLSLNQMVALFDRDVTQRQHYPRHRAQKNSSMGVAAIADFLTKKRLEFRD